MELKQEQALIRAAQSGKESAISELYDAYVDNIYRYFVYRVNRAEDAEDLTAEVFLRFVEGINSYQDRDIPILAWLYRIAHARLIDYYRQQNRIGTTLDEEIISVSAEDDVDAELMATYHLDKLRAALATLTDDQKQVIILRFIEGHSLQKTAELVGKTVGAVKLLQHRGIESLSREFRLRGISFD